MQQADLAYLFSRFPVVSQTFCDTEMLAMERLGQPLVIGSINPPPNSFRHPHLARLQAEVLYPAPPAILKLWEEHAKSQGLWPVDEIKRQESAFGKDTKPGQRARNALYFAREFARRGVKHVHVHFTNRAAHTALFIKALTGIPFSVTAHAQDFMVDLTSRELLRAILNEAQFVIAVSDFSRQLLAEIAPEAEAAGRIHRVYNGQDLESWPAPTIPDPMEHQPPLILSIGRLIEFKGFHTLIEACGILRDKGREFRCEIAGEGPWRPQLTELIDSLNLNKHVKLIGVVNQDYVRFLMREATVFTLASLVDGKGAMDILPTVILEAMAAGKPVVSTRLAGIPEMVLDKESGLLVEPDNAPALAVALGAILENPQMRSQFGRLGRERLETIFSVEQTAPNLLARFQRSIDEKIVPTREQRNFLDKLAATPDATVQNPKRVVYYIPTPPADADELIALLRELNWVRKLCADGEPKLRFAVLWGQFPGNIPELPPELRDALESILRQSRFAPDGLVLEAAWHADRQGALALEGYRQELSPSVPTLEYLEQARLIHGWTLAQFRELPGHWHTIGAPGLLAATILQHTGLPKELNCTLSCTLPEPGPTYSKSMIKALAGDNVNGGRVPSQEMYMDQDCFFDSEDWLPDDLGILMRPLRKRKALDKIVDAFGGAKTAPVAEAWGERLRNWALTGRPDVK